MRSETNGGPREEFVEKTRGSASLVWRIYKTIGMTMAIELVPQQERLAGIRTFPGAGKGLIGPLSTNQRTYKRGVTLFREGDEATHLVRVQEGFIKLMKHGRNGKDVILEICGPGTLMGESSLLDGHPHDATAVAITHATTQWELRREYLARVTQAPEILQITVRSLSARLRESWETLQGLAVERVDTRIASLLVKLSERSTGSSTVPAVIPLTRQEIADAVGAATETTVRVVSRLIREGTVQGRNRQLVVTNLKSLKSLAAAGGPQDE